MIDRPQEDDSREERHVDLVDTSRPLTRDLSKIVESAYIMEAELRHQVARLASVEPRTEAEQEHLAGLINGYNEATYNIRVLRRYHEGRLYRKKMTGDTAPVTETDDDTGLVFGTQDDDPHGARNG